MSKSVLVIDTPGSCMGCSFFICDGDTNMDSCMARETARSVDLEKYDKPDWCPLNPLPDEKEEEYWRSKLSLAWIRGWNTCISKITGGEVDE